VSELTRGEIHCWYVHLDAPAGTVPGLEAALTPAERNRSARFRVERDRRRFVVAHGALHRVLAGYMGAQPREIRFIYNRSGKPALSREFGDRLRFSLSHSADVALIAVARGFDVGVDVERIVEVRPSDYIDLARCFLPRSDVAQLERIPSPLQAEGFFRCWTRQEAYVKARGDGLGGAPVEFGAGWSLYTIHPAPGYVGAVAIQGSDWRVTSKSYR